MSGVENQDRAGIPAASGAAILLLQLAASQAEIGPFALRERETPQAAARTYRAAMAQMRDRRSVLV